jgi:Tol biopolymer transport system component
MNALDRFDLIDARIAGAIDDLAAASRPDYIDDVLKVTAGHRQRPRWTFLERLLPMDTAIRRPIGLRRVPVRSIAVALLLLLLAAVALVYVGSRPRGPAPFGPADNGKVLYIANGDLFVRDDFADNGKLLLGLPGDQFAPSWSPDGQWLSFVTTGEADDRFMVARADGSDAHEIATIPKTGNAQAAWRPDSKAIGLIYDVRGFPRLSVASVDGSPTQQFDLGYDAPTELAWRPPNGAELLVRVIKRGAAIDYLTIRADGTGRHDLGLPSSQLMGTSWYWPAAAWSPDGSRIAYTQTIAGGDRRGGPFRTHLVNADGTADIELPTSAAASVSENWPVFSPDGRWILFNRWTWGDADAGKSQWSWLALMPADGSAPARDIGPKFKADQEIQLAKAWSPDGTRILVYQAEDGGALSIDPATEKVERLTWSTDLPDVQRTLR